MGPMRRGYVRILVLLLALPWAVQAQRTALPLEITFPPRNLRVDGEAVRIAGYTAPQARLTLNGKPARVYPSGAFVGFLPLKEGRNTLRIRAVLGQVERTLDWPVERLAPPRTLPERPTAIADDSLLPGEDCTLLAGDRVTFRFRGSPGGHAWLELGRLHRRLEMAEARPGVYEVEVVIAPEDELEPTRPVFHLRGRDGRSIDRVLASSVAIRDPAAPACGEVGARRTRLYDRPGGDFVQTLPAGAPLLLGGRRGGWQQVWMGLSRFWVPVEDLLLHDTLDCQGEAVLADTLALSTDDALHLRVFSSRPLPVRIIPVSETILRLEYSPIDELCAPPPVEGSDRLLHSATWEATSPDTRALTVELTRPPEWGYGLNYGPGCIDLVVRRCPLRGAPGDLSGLVVALDPGHGGHDRGCVSCTGLFEKDCTLAQAAMVAEQLRARGATVELTRDGDEFVPLDERVERARAADAHLFVSLHFNSLPATTDPLVGRGVSVWYQHPATASLAAALQARLLALGLSDHKLRRNPFRVLLSSDFPCVLVEQLFFSHPEDELAYLSQPFREALAQAVADGVVDWAAAQCGEQVADSARALPGLETCTPQLASRAGEAP